MSAREEHPLNIMRIVVTFSVSSGLRSMLFKEPQPRNISSILVTLEVFHPVISIDSRALQSRNIRRNEVTLDVSKLLRSRVFKELQPLPIWEDGPSNEAEGK